VRDVGRLLINIDNVAEGTACAEGDSHPQRAQRWQRGGA